jgi:hypothetical protein
MRFVALAFRERDKHRKMPAILSLHRNAMSARILSNTPLWVWGLLAALLALGLAQVRPRRIRLRRALALPSAMTILSLLGTVSSFGLVPPVILAWIAATGAAAWLALRRPLPALTRYDSVSGIFDLPGSWVPLALILGIFSIKYAVGAALAIQPALAVHASFASGIAALYGGMSGIFIGRAGRLWRMRR